MARDDTKLQYDSLWEIDQLVSSAETVVGAGDTALYTNLLPVTPFFEIYFKPSGDTRWFRAGNSSTNGSFTGQVSVFAYFSAGKIYINANIAGTARLFVWSDKVDY